MSNEDEIVHVAHLMGMKPHREVREVKRTDGGYLALTHDGIWSRVSPDGKSVRVDIASVPPAAPAEPADDKPAAKRRG